MSDPLVIPPAMRRCLGDYVARRRRSALWRGVGVAITFAMLWLMLWSIVDRLSPLPASAREAILIANLVGVFTLVLRPLRTMLSRRFDWRHAAAQLERRDPRFVGRLETAVSQLLLPATLRASPQFVRKLVFEATELAENKSQARVEPVLPVIRPWLAALVILTGAASLWTNSWLDLPTLVSRQIHPLANIGPVTTTRISIQPGSIDVAQGQTVTIAASAIRLGAAPLMIRLNDGNHKLSTEPMRKGEDGRFVFTLQSVDRDWQYSIIGGDARSEIYSIRVLRKPAIVKLRARYLYPAYMNLTSPQFAETDGLLEAPVGGRALLEMTCTEPVASAAVMLGDWRIVPQPGEQPGTYVATIPINKSGPYRIELRSTRGVETVASEKMIRAIADRPPVVEWLAPRRTLRVNPLDPVRLIYRGSDDFGITSANLSVRVNSKSAILVPLPIESLKDSEPSFTIAPVDWNAMIGDVMELTLVMADASGQQGASEPIQIISSPHSVTMEETRCADELERASRAASSIMEALAEGLRSDEQAQRSKSGGGAGKSSQLNRAADLADQLSRHLLRAIAAGARPALSNLLTDLLDRAVSCHTNIRQAINAEDPFEPDSRPQAIARAQDGVRTLREILRTVERGEQARMIERDLKNFQALVERTETLDASQSELLRESLQLAGREVDSAIVDLGFDPEDEELTGLLEERRQAADQLIEWARLPDAKSWAARISAPDRLPRLLAARNAQMLRSDADFVLARELNRLVNLPAAATPNPTGPDLLSMVLDAAVLPSIRVAAPATQPAQLQARQQMLAGEIASLEQQRDVSRLAGPSADWIFTRLDEMDVLALPEFAAARAQMDSIRANATARNPLLVAKRYSDFAAALLSGAKPDLVKIARFQSYAAAAAQLASNETARRLTAMRVRAVPAIAALLSDSGSASASTTARDAANPAVTAPRDPAVGSAPGGYEDSLRLYFQVLRQSK